MDGDAIVSEAVETTVSEPAIMTEIDQEVLDVPEVVSDVTFQEVLNDKMTGYIDRILNYSQLERTQENLESVYMNLTEKLDQWLTAGDFEIKKFQKREFADNFLQDACKRRGLPNTAASYKIIIDELRKK